MSEFEFDIGNRRRWAESAAWFIGLPIGLQILVAGVFLPASGVITFDMLTGKSKSVSALVAFAVCSAVTLVLVAAERRQMKQADHG